MKALRMTFFSPELDPVTTVVLEDSLTKEIKEAAREIEESAAGAFVITDIFNVPDGSDLVYTGLTAQQRASDRIERERDMALTYYYDAGQFGMLGVGGTLTMTRPAPLSAAELEVPLRQLARHPLYRDFIVMAISEDARLIRMQRGEIQVLD